MGEAHFEQVPLTNTGIVHNSTIATITVRPPGRAKKGARRSIDPVARHKRGADQAKQSCILLRSVANWLSQPCVIAAACDVQQATHSLNGVLILM